MDGGRHPSAVLLAGYATGASGRQEAIEPKRAKLEMMVDAQALDSAAYVATAGVQARQTAIERSFQLGRAIAFNLHRSAYHPSAHKLPIQAAARRQGCIMDPVELEQSTPGVAQRLCGVHMMLEQAGEKGSADRIDRLTMVAPARQTGGGFLGLPHPPESGGGRIELPCPARTVKPELGRAGVDARRGAPLQSAARRTQARLSFPSRPSHVASPI